MFTELGCFKIFIPLSNYVMVNTNSSCFNPSKYTKIQVIINDIKVVYISIVWKVQKGPETVMPKSCVGSPVVANDNKYFLF